MIEKYFLPMLPEEKIILLDRKKPVRKQENFIIKMNGNKMLACAVSILQVSHSGCYNTILYILGYFGCLAFFFRRNISS